MKNSRFLTCEELQERWQIREIDIFAMIKLELIECYKFSMHSTSLEVYSSILIEMQNVKDGFFYKPHIKKYEEIKPEYKPQDDYLPHEDGPPPYLDKKHQYFSKELSIAIETWFAIYGPDGKLNPAQKHKKQIVAYLKKFHPNISESAVERISTMINADVPGAPKTSY